MLDFNMASINRLKSLLAAISLMSAYTFAFFILAPATYSQIIISPVTASKDYDPIVLPITPQDLKGGLRKSSHDAIAEYQWLHRAGYHHQEKTAYYTMNQLRQEQPKNAVVLAGYFMAFRMAGGYLGSLRYNGGHQSMSFTHWDEDKARDTLQMAYKLAPKLWLPYAVDGEDKIYEPNADKKLGLSLLKKAVILAPNVAYTHWLLGDAYTTPPVSGEKYALAAIECKKASALEPRFSNPAFVLFMIYSLWIPDQAEAIKWKRKYYSVLPPDVKINPDAKVLLDRCPN